MLLAESLPGFSLDVVGTVASYCEVVGVARTDDIPSLLFSFPWSFAGFDCVQIACSPDGEIWLLDGVKIRIFTLLGRFQRSIDASTLTLFKKADGKPSRVARFAFGLNDTFFVTHVGHPIVSVHRYDPVPRDLSPADTYTPSSIRIHGAEDPCIAINTRGHLCVTDRITGIGSFFDAKGKESACRMSVIPQCCDIVCDSTDRLLVLFTDKVLVSATGFMKILTNPFSLLSRTCGFGCCFVSFAVDARTDHVVVLDQAHGRIHVLDPRDGSHITSFPSPRRAKALCIDTEGRIYVACKRTVYVFAFGAPPPRDPRVMICGAT